MFPGYIPGTTGVFSYVVQPPLQPPAPSPAGAVPSGVYLPGFPNVDVPDLCQRLFQEISRIVGEAESRFWI